MRLTPEQLSARKKRNIALAVALVAFIVLVFATTILKLQGNRDEAAAIVEGQTIGQDVRPTP
ncbi:hypothetical protein [Brevundimonas sp. LjRoot202]|uniref:hypothetical protein n=1 Tax=Brevundimonas sp. LjRoot202 TaxID=3342281 RepID=UPI003ECF0DD6